MKPRIVYYVLLFTVSLIVMSLLAFTPGINRKGALELDEMIYGTAPKPFVYRQLLPYTVKLSLQAVSDDLREWMTVKASRSSTMIRILSRVSLTPDLFLEYAVTLIFIYLSLWGFIFSFRYLFTLLFESPVYFTDIVTLFATAGIPAFFSYSYIYDIPTLFFFTVGLAAMLNRNWGLYLLVFFLGCWSKETMILLTLVFFIYFFKDQKIKRTLFLRLLAVQVVSFTVIKMLLGIIYSDNPGGLVEFHLLHNLLYGYHFTLSVFLSWVFFCILIFFNWNEKPLFLRNALWIGVPLIILTLFLGLIHEIRDYGEMYPILFGLMAHTVGVVMKIPISVKENV